MKKPKKLFNLKRRKIYSIPKYNQEEQLFINYQKYQLINKRNKNKIKNLYKIIPIIFIILIPFVIRSIKREIHKKNNADELFKKYNSPLEKVFKDMFPRLVPNPNSPPASIKKLFNSRQLYITDTKITSDYIKYIRPIDEEEELKYKKRYSENETVIDKNIFEKRKDQYHYLNFSRIALDEKLIDDKKVFEYSKNPLISVVIPCYNKKDILLKSVRSIQNQNFANIEIIIVNDSSNDNSTELFNYLLESDPRIRIFHHMKNMGCWRTRLDGILYSRGKYVILFDAGDLYEDNYVLTDAFNVMEKYNLDSCKFLFRILRSFNNLRNSVVFFHAGKNNKIVYGPEKIIGLNYKIFQNWGNIWNRLVRANIYTKAFYSLNDLMLNVHKNVWDDSWFNNIVHLVSYSYAVYDRVGYLYLQDYQGEGSPNNRTEEERSKIVKEFVAFLYYDYNFLNKNKSIPLIIKRLKQYNETDPRLKLSNFRSHFEVLNNLLETIINDKDVSAENKTFFKQLLKESKNRGGVAVRRNTLNPELLKSGIMNTTDTGKLFQKE